MHRHYFFWVHECPSDHLILKLYLPSIQPLHIQREHIIVMLEVHDHAIDPFLVAGRTAWLLGGEGQVLLSLGAARYAFLRDGVLVRWRGPELLSWASLCNFGPVLSMDYVFLVVVETVVWREMWIEGRVLLVFLGVCFGVLIWRRMVRGRDGVHFGEWCLGNIGLLFIARLSSFSSFTHPSTPKTLLSLPVFLQISNIAVYFLFCRKLRLFW